MTSLEYFLTRAEALLSRLETVLPPTAPDTDWSASTAFCWRTRQGRGFLQPVPNVSDIHLDDLQNIERQKAAIEQNTRQFVRGRPANTVLLTGARGTGKSSLIKACLNAYATEGLRLIEVDKDDLHDFGDIVEQVAKRGERFLVFCDDLSFENGESGYKALKVALDGSIAAQSDNVLIYATSNRRHLLPEYMKDNETYKHTEDGEIHPRARGSRKRSRCRSASVCGSASIPSSKTIIWRSSPIGCGTSVAPRPISTARAATPWYGRSNGARVRDAWFGSSRAIGRGGGSQRKRLFNGRRDGVACHRPNRAGKRV